MFGKNKTATEKPRNRSNVSLPACLVGKCSESAHVIILENVFGVNQGKISIFVGTFNKDYALPSPNPNCHPYPSTQLTSTLKPTLPPQIVL